MRLLFVSKTNTNLGPTAAQVFDAAPYNYETRSVGLQGDTEISLEDLQWADLVFVMHEEQLDALVAKFPNYKDKRRYNLDVPDVFNKNEPHLVALLKDHMSRFMPF